MVAKVFRVRDHLLKQARDVRVIELIDLVATLLLGMHETEIAQDSQVLRDRGLFHPGRGRQIFD